MTDDRRVLTLLGDLLDELPTVAPDRLVASVHDSVRTTTQRRRSPWRREPRFVRSGATGFQIAAVAAFAVVAVLVVGLVWIAPGTSVPGAGAVPSGSPGAASPSASASSSPEIPIALEDGQALISGALYTSVRFEPLVTFRLRPPRDDDPPGAPADWCSAYQMGAPSNRTIGLSHPKGCLNELRLFRPFAVDCGTPDAHPDVDGLASAVLNRPGLEHALDLGTLQTVGAVPDDLFLDDYPGRVIDIGWSQRRLFDATATDPDQCRLLPEPGSRDPVIEIRGDLDARLVLLDVADELIVLRVADGGYDAATGAAAHERGYGTAQSDLHEHLLTRIYDLQFHPNVASPVAASQSPRAASEG